MTIRTGETLAHYTIHEKLGEGGMGEVYRATDTRLGRSVAIKVLPAALSLDAERLARLDREARLLAQLNHPNIASIFGLEPLGDERALVLELVDGPTLADRLAAGPLELDEALACARQIVAALEEAHDKGIVHRDLKPANVKVSPGGRLKVLDFGLAKGLQPAISSGEPADRLSASPTVTKETGLGVILGTAPYMSPEQARGRPVDERTDIWAFGVVLVEMLTGSRLFAGETVLDTLTAVLKGRIDFTLPPETPPAIWWLVQRCLDRDPRDRLRDIGEARVALERLGDDPAHPGRATVDPKPAPTRRREAAAWALTALAITCLAVLLIGGDKAPPPTLPARFHLLPPTGMEFLGPDGPVTLSPDGGAIVFAASLPTKPTHGLFVRRLDSFETWELPGTAETYEPFWSPDGRYVGFFGTHLETIDVRGLQPAQKLAPVSVSHGGSWSKAGIILYAPSAAGGLFRIDVAGGQPKAVTELDPAREELAHMRPSFLPDGRHFLYLVRSARPENSGVFVGSLDGGVKKRLLPTGRAATFAPPNHVLAIHNRDLVARELDLRRLELVGEPTVVASDVGYIEEFHSALVSASPSRLAYHPVSTPAIRQIVRFDRSGSRLGTLGENGDFNMDISPDGRRLAVARLVHPLDGLGIRPDGRHEGSWVWVYDLDRGGSLRLGTEDMADGPVFSPDSRSIAYVTWSDVDFVLAVRPATGGPARVVWRSASGAEPVDWSPDGAWLLVETSAPGQGMNLVLVAAGGNGEAEVVPFATTAAREHSGRFSTDGRFVAYVSNESGRSEILIDTLPPTGAKQLVSLAGGLSPRWRADGSELFFVEPDARGDGRTLMVVAIQPSEGGLELGVPAPLFEVESLDYEIARDGREIFVGTPIAEAVTPPPVLIEEWPALLSGRAQP